MMRLIIALMLLGACGPGDAPDREDCKEFDWVTKRDGVPTECRILWCAKKTSTDQAHGGPTALWCAPVDSSTEKP